MKTKEQVKELSDGLAHVSRNIETAVLDMFISSQTYMNTPEGYEFAKALIQSSKQELDNIEWKWVNNVDTQ